MGVVCIVIALGLVNWFGTLLIVESEFFKPLHRWVATRREKVNRRFPAWFWWKFEYLIDCYMCTGTWVALALVPFAPLVFGAGWMQYTVLGLLIKAIGHIVLSLHKYIEAVTEESAERKRTSRREFIIKRREGGQ